MYTSPVTDILAWENVPEPCWPSFSNFLGNKADVELVVVGYKRARRFWNTPALRKFRLGDDEAFPGLNFTSDEAILDIIKTSYNTINMTPACAP